MKGQRAFSLRIWLAVLVGGALVPLLAFAGLALVWLAGGYREQADRGQADTTRALALAVEAEVRAWRTALWTLAEARDLRDGRFREFDAMARSVAASHDGWLVVNDATGQQRVNTLLPLGSPLPKTSAGSMVQAVIREGQPLTDLVFGAVAQRHIISNSVPVFRDGKVVFCLSLNFGPERLGRLLDAQRLPPTWIAAVVNGERRVVARSPHRPERAGQRLVEPLQIALASASQGIVETTMTDGRVGRVAFQRLRDLPWVVLVAVPLVEVQAGWRTPLLGFLAAGALLGLLALGVSVAVARRIARPIHALTRSSESMLRGEMVPAAPGTPILEVQQLQSALLEGAERVQAFNLEREQAAAALRRANEGLERQVAERTAALSRANAELEETNIRLERVNSESQEANIQLEETTAELQQELEERQRAEAQLHSAALFPEQNPYPILRIAGDGTLLYANQGARPLLTAWGAAVGGRLVDPDCDELLAALMSGEVREVLVTCGDRVYSLAGVPFAELQYINVYGRDVTERQRMVVRLEEALTHEQEALADNMALLREVHHRVKNNLQMLCDLLYLQAEALPHPEAKDALRDAYGRVFAIARLHEQLYQSMQRGRVQLGEYLGRLVAGLADLRADVPVSLDARDAVYMDIDRAIHIGLIVNELVTNASKHAYPAGIKGGVVVTLRALGERLEVEVSDNGQGLPADLDLEQTKTLGLRIVHILARRLEATVQIDNRLGARFTISLPLHARE
jgi:two-component sensor histidine kinase